MDDRPPPQRDDEKNANPSRRPEDDSGDRGETGRERYELPPGDGSDDERLHSLAHANSFEIAGNVQGNIDAHPQPDTMSPMEYVDPDGPWVADFIDPIEQKLAAGRTRKQLRIRPGTRLYDRVSERLIREVEIRPGDTIYGVEVGSPAGIRKGDPYGQ